MVTERTRSNSTSTAQINSAVVTGLDSGQAGLPRRLQLFVFQSLLCFFGRFLIYLKNKTKLYVWSVESPPCHLNIYVGLSLNLLNQTSLLGRPKADWGK